ncbi:MAG TPA: potassium transporter TrkG [Planctomycetota bacterium]|nr:potassium transporter TrkG [Planctomycetota bacterium]
MSRWLGVLRWFTRAGALIALCGVVAEFGFGLDEETLAVLHAIEYSVVGIFTFNAALHLLGAKNRRAFLRENWLDAAFLAVLVVNLALALSGERSDVMTRVYFVGVQLLIVMRTLISLARAQERFAGPRIRPALLLLISFVVLVLVGTAALMMPRCLASAAEPLTLIDALFTSTSAVCVTGLSVRDIGTALSLRGQGVLLVLIQVGGLGLVTIGTAITVIERSRPNLHFVALANDLLGLQSFAALRRFLRYTVLITLAVEGAGAAILIGSLPGESMTLLERAWWGLFHSVSAFCNAGFGLSAQNLVPWADRPVITMTIAGLIVLGGLGFPVIIDLLRFQLTTLHLFQLARTRLSSVRRVRWITRKWGFFPWLRSPSSALQLPRPSKLELNSKLVLVTTGLLIAVGAVLFYFSEQDGVLAKRDGLGAATDSIFQSITTRTAGFNTVDLELLALPTLLLIIALMAIGASAVSTGGGIKTATTAVVFLTIRAMMRGREQVEAFGRAIPARIVHASISVVALYFIGVASVTTLLAATQHGIVFLDLLFESISALSTVGLTHGVTPRLDSTGKVIITVAMLLGRVGPLAIVWTFLARGERLRYRYPEEDVVIS